MDIVENDRRMHHYRFAHKVLAGLALDAGPRLLDGDPPDGFTGGLVSVWNGFGTQLPPEERLPSDGLTAELITLGPHRLLVVVLPPPIAAAEAYYTAVVQPDGADYVRYFTLEYAMNPFTGEPYTVLGEWADGNHFNHGQGPTADLSAFLSAVIELLAKPGQSLHAVSTPAPAQTPAPAPASVPVQAQAQAPAQAPAAAPAPVQAPAQEQAPERRGLRKLFGR